MSDTSPKVDFGTPWSNMQALQAKRHKLQSAARDIRSSLRDVDRLQLEAVRDAEMAMVWAATLMVCDIVRIGLSAADRRASAAFSAYGRAIEAANRVLKLLGSPGIVTKADLLKSLGPEFDSSIKAIESLRKAKSELKRVETSTSGKSIPIGLPKEAGVLVDLGAAMAEDSILMLQAGNLQRQSNVNAVQSRMMMRQHLQRVLTRLVLIDGEITREYERLRILGNTA